LPATKTSGLIGWTGKQGRRSSSSGRGLQSVSPLHAGEYLDSEHGGGELCSTLLGRSGKEITATCEKKKGKRLAGLGGGVSPFSFEIYPVHLEEGARASPLKKTSSDTVRLGYGRTRGKKRKTPVMEGGGDLAGPAAPGERRGFYLVEAVCRTSFYDVIAEKNHRRRSSGQRSAFSTTTLPFPLQGQ